MKSKYFIGEISMQLKRKLQVSNGHYLEFDQLSRLIHTIYDSNLTKIKNEYLSDQTGMPYRQVRNRISIGRALGIFERNRIKLSDFGKLLSEHDIFFEKTGSLEYCHYLAASNHGNLIWFEIFNTVLLQGNSYDYKELIKYFRTLLYKKYSDFSLVDHLGKEIRFIVDAYNNKKFNKLGFIMSTSDGKFYKSPYIKLDPKIFSAMIYSFGSIHNTLLFQVDELMSLPGSPAVVLGMDEPNLKKKLETIHNHGWIRYETTFDLNQIRLKSDLNQNDFLLSYFENEEIR